MKIDRWTEPVITTQDYKGERQVLLTWDVFSDGSPKPKQFGWMAVVTDDFSEDEARKSLELSFEQWEGLTKWTA